MSNNPDPFDHACPADDCCPDEFHPRPIPATLTSRFPIAIEPELLRPAISSDSDLEAVLRTNTLLGRQLAEERTARDVVQKHGNETLEELRALRRLDKTLRLYMEAMKVNDFSLLHAISDVNAARGAK